MWRSSHIFFEWMYLQRLVQFQSLSCATLQNRRQDQQYRKGWWTTSTNSNRSAGVARLFFASTRQDQYDVLLVLVITNRARGAPFTALDVGRTRRQHTPELMRWKLPCKQLDFSIERVLLYTTTHILTIVTYFVFIQLSRTFSFLFNSSTYCFKIVLKSSIIYTGLAQIFALNRMLIDNQQLCIARYASIKYHLHCGFLWTKSYWIRPLAYNFGTCIRSGVAL